MLSRHILHIHIPSFPIAVEQVCRPELKDRPVAVVPPHSERALILSVSSVARKEGVYKGMPIAKAIKFCPDLTVLPPNPGLMKKAFQDLINRQIFCFFRKARPCSSAIESPQESRRQECKNASTLGAFLHIGNGSP